MPVEGLRWETLEALRNSSKGKLKYNPDWREKGEDILAGCNDSPSLSPLSGFILTRVSPRALQKTCSLFSVSRGSCPGLSDEIPASLSSTSSENAVISSSSPPGPSPIGHEQIVDGETSGEDTVQNSSTVSSPQSPPTISLLSPKATQMAGCIRICEENHRAKAKRELSFRQERQERLVVSVASRESEQLKRFEELMELKQRQEYQSMRDMMDRETKESIGRQEKLKEEHRHRMKILNLRLREAEQQRLREAEQERQRQADGRERLRNLNTVQEEILQLHQLLDPSDVTAHITRGNQLCSLVSEVVHTTAEGAFPTVEDMTVAERALHDMRRLVGLVQEEKARAQERRRQEQEAQEESRRQKELQVQQEEQKKVALSAKEKAAKRGLQTRAEDVTLKWFKQVQGVSAQCVQSLEELNSTKDVQTKKLRMELQKAATIPVSQISTISGSQLREILDKIDKLLSGRSVVVGGKSVSVSQHPKGLEFVSYKLAEKFVKQGEEEVAAHHEAAFPIAVVASGVWQLHPRVGDLILAHFHKKCPYTIPHYPPMKEGTSLEEYQRILGYRVDDSGVEGQDSFLKRMSGMIRLYAAIIQQRWPYGNKQAPDPHGLNHGWRWLAQMLNMEPLADITATLLLDFLEVCGHALLKQYGGQFWKLLLLLQEEYFPRIKAVSSAGQMGAVARLEKYLTLAFKDRNINSPKGQLSTSFWRT